MIDSASKHKSNIPTCPVCKYEYDSYYHNPRVIPKCGHTFCQKCINSSLQVRANRKVYICPECQSQTIIRKGAAEDIPKNIGILDIAKNMKKLQYQQSSPMSHKSPLKDSPSKVKQFCKQHPNKQLDLVCQTCNFEKVCSICALISSNHREHKFVEYVPASKFDLNEVKEVFVIIDDTVKQTILPDAKQNIIKKTEQNLINRLIGSVKDHFRDNYYKFIEKKQQQVIAQVREIKFQGGIDKKIEQIAKSYDLLKTQYLNIFNKSTSKQNTSLQIVQEFIQKCKSLHSQVQVFSEHAQRQSKFLFQQISTKISQSIFFRLNQLPFSLKNLLSQKLEITSPSRQKNDASNSQSKRSSGFDLKSSARGQKSNSKRQDDVKSIESLTLEVEKKPFTATSITHKKSGFMPPKHNINKSQARLQKKEEQIIPILLIDSKVQQKKSSSSQAKQFSSIQRLKKSSIENISKIKKSVQKDKGSTSKLNCSQISKQQPFTQQQSSLDSQQLRVKQVRPVKQIPLSLKSKFSAITKQINRQAQSQSLQLIGMEINDSLIVYVCDYLKSKRLKFVMIKLVKNNLTDEGLSVLLGHLMIDDRIQVLNLTSNQLSAKSLDLFIEIGGKNNLLKTIYLSHNKVSASNVKQKAKQLENLGLEIII